MTEVAGNTKNTFDKSIGRWLFNPFRFIAGYHALLLGLGLILLTAFTGRLSDTHFDGVLDIHTGLKAPLPYFFAEGLVNWLSIAIPLYFFGLIVSRSTFRLIDVFGTQALARGPYLVAAIAAMPEANKRFGMYLVSRTGLAAATPINYADTLVFIFSIIVMILMAIWMVALMYRAYSVSCNIKGAKAISTFILSLIGAEVLSKFTIMLLYS